MDEKSGMNFSEYMDILSGNTDLLDKAKLEKRIASLESERKVHSKGIANSKFRYQTITHDIANNEATKTDTHGHYQRIGEVYGFLISIISERALVDGKESVLNSFVIEGNRFLPTVTLLPVTTTSLSTCVESKISTPYNNGVEITDAENRVNKISLQLDIYNKDDLIIFFLQEF